jgi:hypothetical protein
MNGVGEYSARPSEIIVERVIITIIMGLKA